MLKHINQISEQAFLLDFGSIIDIQTNSFVISFANHIIDNIELNYELGIKNCTPSYNKILIQFDPNSKKKREILDFLYSINLKEFKSKETKEFVEIPICYDDEYSLDLADISQQIKLTKEEIINIHLNTSFHVYMIGFMPGYPFMGDIDKILSVPRKLSPRLNVPKGSVAIVGNLCGIYPNNSPGGWNIIGNTPLNLFLKNNNEPTLLKPGNKVKFKSISKSEFDLIIQSHEK
jgi:KipI family sensor histidine kinase inhibitor